jgi:hypothetical protein
MLTDSSLETTFYLDEDARDRKLGRMDVLTPGEFARLP